MGSTCCRPTGSPSHCVCEGKESLVFGLWSQCMCVKVEKKSLRGDCAHRHHWENWRQIFHGRHRLQIVRFGWRICSGMRCDNDIHFGAHFHLYSADCTYTYIHTQAPAEPNCYRKLNLPSNEKKKPCLKFRHRSKDLCLNCSSLYTLICTHTRTHTRTPTYTNTLQKQTFLYRLLLHPHACPDPYDVPTFGWCDPAPGSCFFKSSLTGHHEAH